MKFEDFFEAMMNMTDDNKTELSNFFHNVRKSLRYIGNEIEPLFKHLMIDKSVEYTTEKFKLLCSNGFTRDEAIRIIIGDNNRIESALRNGVSRGNTKIS